MHILILPLPVAVAESVDASASADSASSFHKIVVSQVSCEDARSLLSRAAGLPGTRRREGRLQW